MTDVNEVKPDTRAAMDHLYDQIDALNTQVDALELPSRIEFCRLLRIAENSVEFIAMRANDLERAKGELEQKNKAVYKAGLCTMGIGLLYWFGSNYYTLSSAISIPFWLFIAAWYGKAAFDVWDCERKLENAKEIYANYRFDFFSAGFSIPLMDDIAHFAQKESTEAFSDAYMMNENDIQVELLNDMQIELALKTACFKLCRGVHDYGYRHIPPFEN